MKKSLLILSLIAAGTVVQAQLGIQGDNVVGFTDTALSATHTALAVPFVSCTNTTIPITELVATDNLTGNATAASADQLIVFDSAATNYYYYYLNGSKVWTAMNTIKAGVPGSVVVETAPAPETLTLSKGFSFWLKKQAATTNVFLQGQVDASAQSTTIGAGFNLVGSSYPASLNLNATTMTWSSITGIGLDEVFVAGADGVYSKLVWKTDAWKKAYVTTNWNEVLQDFVATTTWSNAPAIPEGAGFWYNRKGSGTFNFNPAAN